MTLRYLFHTLIIDNVAIKEKSGTDNFDSPILMHSYSVNRTDVCNYEMVNGKLAFTILNTGPENKTTANLNINLGSVKAGETCKITFDVNMFDGQGNVNKNGFAYNIGTELNAPTSSLINSWKVLPNGTIEIEYTATEDIANLYLYLRGQTTTINNSISAGQSILPLTAYIDNVSIVKESV